MSCSLQCLDAERALPTLTSALIAQAAGTPRGLAGLSNLGNTCFMNSSLQCLSHTAPLARVFLSGAFAADLNRDNPLGNCGELAEAFGALMRRLWQARGLLAPAHCVVLLRTLCCLSLPCALLRQSGCNSAAMS
jgi:hypothetical protein